MKNDISLEEIDINPREKMKHPLETINFQAKAVPLIVRIGYYAIKEITYHSEGQNFLVEKYVRKLKETREELVAITKRYIGQVIQDSTRKDKLISYLENLLKQI
ncbi:Uncharacterised protein [uncultured archaeon]|nr:Uncharacterised protein [uncultured archaeon]